MYETNELHNIPLDYPLVPGDWDIIFSNLGLNRIRLIKLTLVKEINIKFNDKIISAQRVR